MIYKLRIFVSYARDDLKADVAHRGEGRPSKADVRVAPCQIVGGQLRVPVAAHCEIGPRMTQRLGEWSVRIRTDDDVLRGESCQPRLAFNVRTMS